ncbi:tetratricopeptide repeat protein [Asticcacaulis sp.]|uniref:tetratricopeptide repeat protein n=1 Tax=Asticcacaulis sp. TaxID=1872648 RepID=UPI0039E25DDC
MQIKQLVSQAAEAEANLDFPKAFDLYEEALKLAPDSLEIATRLAALAFRLNMWPMAEKLYSHLITHGIHNMSVITSFAASLREQSRYEEAIDVLKTVINQRPDESSLWEGLGTVMMAQGDGGNALTFFNEALRLTPSNLHARFNRGCALLDQGEVNASLEDLGACANAFDDPDNRASAQIAYAQGLLIAGRLDEGWRAYEGRERFGTAKQVHYALWSQRWREGQPLANRNLLVSAEQGLGDEVLFASILPDMIRDIGPEGILYLAVEPRLVPLFQRSFPQAQVVGHRTQIIDGLLQRSFPALENAVTDGWALLGDFLPVYRKTVEDFPAENRFLTPDPERVAHWRRELAAISEKPKVGLLWKSLKQSAQRDRYFPAFEDMFGLLTLENVTFINLQYGNSSAEAILAEQNGLTMRTLPGIDLKDDLDDLAALCTALDLVVSPSNATSNISAACGVPTWFLSQANGWLQLGTDHYPWYPSVQMFAPPALGNWKPAIDDIAAALKERFAL